MRQRRIQTIHLVYFWCFKKEGTYQSAMTILVFVFDPVDSVDKDRNIEISDVLLDQEGTLFVACYDDLLADLLIRLARLHLKFIDWRPCFTLSFSSKLQIEVTLICAILCVLPVL